MYKIYYKKANSYYIKNWENFGKRKGEKKMYRIQYNNTTISIKQLANILNINYSTLVNYKNRTGKDYIDILKDKYNVNIICRGLLYYFFKA